MRGITVTTVRDGVITAARFYMEPVVRDDVGIDDAIEQATGRGPGMIAIAGGTGNLGRALVPRLLDAGDEVRILARHPDRIPDAWRDRVEGRRDRRPPAGNDRGRAGRRPSARALPSPASAARMRAASMRSTATATSRSSMPRRPPASSTSSSCRSPRRRRTIPSSCSGRSSPPSGGSGPRRSPGRSCSPRPTWRRGLSCWDGRC